MPAATNAFFLSSQLNHVTVFTQSDYYTTSYFVAMHCMATELLTL